MARFYVAFLAALTAVQGLRIRRDSAPILNSLDTITSQLRTLGDLLESFNIAPNNTAAALQIQGETMTLQTDVDDGITATSGVQPLNEGDSVVVTEAVVGLQTDVYHVLDQLVAKKPVFDQAILGVGSASALVRSDLLGLRNSTLELGSGIVSKMVEDLQRLGPLVTYDIDYHFAEALRVYA